MRIGEAAKRSGVSARMVRYYDQQGYLGGRDRVQGQHRTFDEEDVQELRLLRSLLAAGVPAPTAGRVARGSASSEEVHQADQALIRTAEEVQAARARITSGGPKAGFIEHQLSLPFDLFLARTRLESLISLELEAAGITSGDYGVVSLVSLEPLTAAGLARLVGAAPSSLAGRLASLVARGWLTRSIHPLDPRSWVLVATPEGDERVDRAVPYARRLFARLDDALRAEGLDPLVFRSQVQLFSAVVRSMLPEP